MSGAILAEGAGVLLAGGPSDGGFDRVSVSPGLGGFVTMFAIVLVVVLLMLDMARRVRRIQARENVEEDLRREAEDAERRADGDGGAEAPHRRAVGAEDPRPVAGGDDTGRGADGDETGRGADGDETGRGADRDGTDRLS